MIITNGFPKSGNHALVKAVELLGLQARVTHNPYAGGFSGDPRPKHLFVIRDPRNIVVSWLRFRNEAVNADTFIARLCEFDGRPLVGSMAEYEGWLSDPDTHVVRYEDLIRDDTAHRRIADYLGVPYVAKAWESLPGYTMTWTPIRSDYRTIWTPEVEASWQAEGGPDLLKRWGY
jgi:hypothetical protein